MRSRRMQLAALLITTLLVYAASLQNGYVHLDDTNYLVNNELVTDFSADHLGGLFTSVRGNFTPLTWLTHIAAWELSGEAPFGHHLVSLLFHLLNVALVFVVVGRLQHAGLFERMTGWAEYTGYVPFFTALLFALHPQNAEAVCWLAARKDLVMTTFVLLSGAFYIRFAQTRSIGPNIAAAVTFCLACLAKPTAVMWIVVMPLLEAAASGRTFVLRRAIVNVLPLVLIAAAITYFAYGAQQSAGAFDSGGQFGALDRLVIVLKNLFSYFTRYFLAGDYFVNYPLNKDLVWQTFAGGAGLLALCAALARETWRAHGLAWLCTVVLLLPSVGLIQYGVQATADRFAYMAFLPAHLSIVVLAIAGMRYVQERRMVQVIRAATVLAFLLLAQLTFLQASVWRNDLSLWAHGVRAQPQNPLAYQYLGDAFLRNGKPVTAIESYRQSIETIGSGVYMDTQALYFGLGRAHYALEEYDTAHEWFSRLFNEDAESFSRIGYAYYFVAEILLRKGRDAEALLYVQESLQRVPAFTPAVELEARLRAP